MARRYRCTNCNTEFAADKPACATCDIDATTDPQAAHVIHPLVLIHYDPPHPKIKNRGRGRRACDPKVPVGKGRASGEARAVNCDACKATEVFQDAVKAGALNTSFLDSEDEIVGVSVKGVITAKKADCENC